MVAARSRMSPIKTCRDDEMIVEIFPPVITKKIPKNDKKENKTLGFSGKIFSETIETSNDITGIVAKIIVACSAEDREIPTNVRMFNPAKPTVPKIQSLNAFPSKEKDLIPSEKNRIIHINIEPGTYLNKAK